MAWGRFALGLRRHEEVGEEAKEEVGADLTLEG